MSGRRDHGLRENNFFSTNFSITHTLRIRRSAIKLIYCWCQGSTFGNIISGNRAPVILFKRAFIYLYLDKKKKKKKLSF